MRRVEFEHQPVGWTRPITYWCLLSRTRDVRITFLTSVRLLYERGANRLEFPEVFSVLRRRERLRFHSRDEREMADADRYLAAFTAEGAGKKLTDVAGMSRRVNKADRVCRRTGRRTSR